MRPMYFHYDKQDRCIYACTNRGTVLKMNLALEVVATSAPSYNLNVLNVITTDSRYIYAREITGKLARWRKSDLRVDRIVDLAYWNPIGSASFPNVSHFLKLHNDHVYVAMPSGKTGKFRQTDLAYVSESPSTFNALVECVDTTNSEHFAVDFAGYLYRGDIDGEMKVAARIGHGATHQVTFDRRYERYWITDDFHCGLALYSVDSPDVIRRLDLTNDDVEGMSFNPDQSELLVACFDRYVYRLRNDENPRVVGRYGPLGYQVTQIEWIATDHALALTEAGEIYIIDLITGELKASATGSNAVWDIKRSRSVEDIYWVAFEDGFLREIKVDGPSISVLREKNLHEGMIRRVLPDPNGGVFALLTSGSVVKLDRDLEILWRHSLAPLLRDMDLHGDNLIVCGESGEIALLDASTGRLKWTRNLGEPLWAVSITPDGCQFMVAHRSNDRSDQGRESTGQGGRLWAGDLQNGEIYRERRYRGNIKKLTWIDESTFIMNGNGEIATSLVDFRTMNTLKHWSAWQLNTAEAILVAKGRLYTTTYGYQLNTFDLDGELLESAFPFEDYATSLASTSSDSGFIAGGRGAFLSLFEVREDRPHLVQTVRFA